MDLINRDDIHITVHYARMNGKREVTDALVKAIEEAIFKLPVIDAEPVRHGHWIVQYKTNDGRSIRCSECRMSYWVGYGRDGKYCPECGAKMDGEIEEE